MSALADASGAIGRLDARISATALAPAWRLRASWNGYAKALSLQHLEIEEIDIISWRCGVNGQRTLHPTPHANSPDRQNSLHRRYFLTPFNIRAAA
ncbi:hypothetical protein ACHT3C_19850, partial [Sphingobium sp. R-7]